MRPPTQPENYLHDVRPTGGMVTSSLEQDLGELPRPEPAAGLLFSRQSVESLVKVIQAFEAVELGFLPVFIRAHVQRFDVSRCKRRMTEFSPRK